MGRMILDDNPYLDEHFIYEDGVKNFVKMVKGLRDRQYQIVVDFMANPRSCLMSLGSGAQRRISFRTNRRFAYTDVVPRPPGTDYVVRDKMKLLRVFGADSDDTRLDLPWNERHTGPLLRLMGESPAFRDAPVRVALSPTHRRSERQWTLERYARLAEELSREWRAEIVWLWGPGEEDVVTRAAALTQAKSMIAPKTSFREMAALLANFDLFVGNSNGVSHLAVAVDCPSLQLHGPTLKSSWSPLTASHRGLQAGIDGDGPHMHQLPLEAVSNALSDMRGIVMQRAEARKRSGLRLRWTAPAPGIAP